jgi:hypothetical protein
VNGTVVAGQLAHDAGGGNASPSNTTDGRVWGPYFSGKVTFATGAITLTLSTTASTGRDIAWLSTNGTSVTVNTMRQHGLWPGAHISISGTTSYNGSYTVTTVTDSMNFTFSKAGSFATETAGTYALTALPTVGDAITANYTYGAWGVGTGLLDEANNHSWSSTDPSTVNLSGLSSQMRNDLNDFLQALAYQFFNGSKTAVQNYMPGVLYVGPDAISTSGWPARAPVLKAAASTIDVMTTSYGPQFTQAGLDYIYTYFGDKPIFDSFYATANTDSPYAGNQDTAYFFATHTIEGQAYYNRLTSILNRTYTSTGSHPYVGIGVWSYIDMNDGTPRAWGRVSVLDNAYNGSEDVTGAVECSSSQGYQCGGEAATYTDVISQTTAANLLWLMLPN